MKGLLVLVATAALGVLHGGTLNVIHLGPGDPLKFKVQAGPATQEFTVAHGHESGPFMLPEALVRLDVILDGVPTLELPVSDKPRLAILAPTASGFRWHLEVARAIDDRWAFRAINLTPQAVDLQLGKAAVAIPGLASRDLPVDGPGQIRLQTADGLDLGYAGRERRGVVGLLYQREGRWRGLLLPDR